MKFILVLICTIILSSCANNTDEKIIDVKFQRVMTFGTQNGNEDEIIGHPISLTADKKQNLFVFDYAFKKIKKFSAGGNFISIFGKGEGKGPGEFKEPRGIDVDSFGNIYVTDMQNRCVTIFDSSGVFVKTLYIKMSPFLSRAVNMENVFLIGFPDSYTGDLIAKYDVLHSENPIREFGKRYISEDSFNIEHCGFANLIILNSAMKQVIISKFYPYSIEVYSYAGDFLFELKRDVSFFAPPYKVRDNPLYIKPIAGVQNSFMASENIFINILFFLDEDNRKVKSSIDFWDLKEKKFLGNFTAEQLGIKIERFCYSNEDGYFYNYESEPYPHISKYKIVISNK